MKTQNRFQPRFLAYARAHNRIAEAQLAFDEKAWPGGIMCGFILWMDERIREFNALHGTKRAAIWMPKEFDAFILASKRQ